MRGCLCRPGIELRSVGVLLCKQDLLQSLLQLCTLYLFLFPEFHDRGEPPLGTLLLLFGLLHTFLQLRHARVEIVHLLVCVIGIGVGRGEVYPTDGGMAILVEVARYAVELVPGDCRLVSYGPL